MHISNKLQAIYDAANRPEKCDNRNFATKAINTALQFEHVQILIAPQGKVFVSGTKKHNVKIRVANRQRTALMDVVSSEKMLPMLASLLEETKSQMPKESEGTKCCKCNGSGIIKAFMHIYNGVCFDCLGIGYTFKSNAQ
jgi:hypothetical protein